MVKEGLSNMKSKIAKWGNSLGVRIPQKLADLAKIHEGVNVVIEVKDEVVMIKRESLSLEELIDKITPENIHPEISTGGPVGKEIW